VRLEGGQSSRHSDAPEDGAFGFAPDGGSFRVPPLQGRNVHLRPLSVGDYDRLRLIETTGELGIRWRFRGSTPSPEEWARSIGSSALAQFLVVRNSDDAPIGLVLCYGARFQDQHASLGAASFSGETPSPLMVLGVALFVEYVFTCWSFQKLYLKVPEYNLHQFKSGIGRFFELEGRLRRHLYYGGRFWDQCVLALYREVWNRHSSKMLQAETIRTAHVRIHFPDSQ
jgi:hypothetical protein